MIEHKMKLFFPTAGRVASTISLSLRSIQIYKVLSILQEIQAMDSHTAKLEDSFASWCEVNGIGEVHFRLSE